MKTFRNLILIGILSFIGSGCMPSDSIVLTRISEAEQLTWENGDSALKIIQSIPNPENLTGKEQADYALLLSHLQYRCDVPFTSDSLIHIAWEYYKESRDWDKRGKAWYMKGSVLEEHFKQIPEAIIAYKQAEKCIPQMTDHYLPSRIYTSLALLNKRTQNYDIAITYHRKALEQDVKTKDIDAQAADWLNLSAIYRLVQKTDSDRWAIEGLLKMRAEIEDSVLRAKVNHNIAIRKLAAGDTMQAEPLLLEALKWTPRRPSRKTLTKLAQIYHSRGEKEKADSLFQQVLKEADLSTRADMHRYFYKEALSRKAYEEAARHAASLIKAQEEHFIHSRQKETLEIQEKYDYMEVLYQSTILKNRLYLVILLLLVAAIGGICVFKLYVRRLQKRYNHVMTDIAQLQEKLVKTRKEGYVHKEKAEELQAQIADKDKELHGLTNRIKLISRLDSSLISTDNVRMMEVVMSVVENRTCDLKNDRIYIRKWINLSENSLVERLQQLQPVLKEQYIDICCLLAMGLTVKETAQAMDISPTTVDRYLSQIGTERQFGTGGKKGFIAWFNELTGVRG